jgi:PAS domain S-box-containing protein
VKIGTRLIIYLVVTLIVVMSAHALINVIQSNTNLREEVRRTAEKVARIVADGTRIHLKTGDEKHLIQLLSILGRLEGVLDLVVHSEDGNILGRFHIPTKTPPGQSEIENPKSFPREGLSREIRWGEKKAFERILRVSVPGGTSLAFVHVVMDLTFIEHHSLRTRWTNVATIALMTTLLAVLFFFFIRSSVVLPLEALTRAVTAYREGKWDGEITISGDDEIGALAGEFNVMVQEIEKSNRHLIMEREHQLAVVESLREGVIVLDTSGSVTSWNPASLDLAGIQGTEDPAATFPRFFKEADSVFHSALDEIARDKRSEVLLPPFDWKCVDGRTRRVRVNAQRLVQGPMAGGTLVVFEDVTEQEALSQQVLRAERLASLGQLASALAHEIGTPLNVVSGRVQQALTRIDENHPAREKLYPIVGQIDRITGLIKNLLEFARGSQFKPHKVDLNREISEVLNLVETTREHSRVDLELQLSDTLPPLHADAAQMQQLVLNLCMNAFQVMPEGGRLLISTTAMEDEIILEITDSGPGISESDVSRVFDPFFTTKDIDEGTGLGLTVCHRIVEDHGGRIDVSSPPGEGATFRVILPLQPKGVIREQSIA